MIISDAVIQGVGALGGGMVVGFLAGFALRKIIKWVAIIVGAFLVGLIALAARGWLIVSWDKINNSLGGLANSTATTAGATDAVHNVMNAIGVPATSGMAVGFVLGFIKG